MISSGWGSSQGLLETTKPVQFPDTQKDASKNAESCQNSLEDRFLQSFKGVEY